MALSRPGGIARPLWAHVSHVARVSGPRCFSVFLPNGDIEGNDVAVVRSASTVRPLGTCARWRTVGWSTAFLLLSSGICKRSSLD